MNRLLIAIIFLINCYLYSNDKLDFTFGEHWEGEITSYENGSLKLKSSFTPNDLEFSLENLNSVEFSNHKILSASHKVTLINKDSLMGELIELNNDYLILNTVTSGVLKISREHIAAVDYLNKTNPLEETTELRKGWTGEISVTGEVKGTLSRVIESKKAFILSMEADLSNTGNFFINLKNRSQMNNRVTLITEIRNQKTFTSSNGIKRFQDSDGFLAITSMLVEHSRQLLGSNKYKFNSDAVKLKFYFDPKTLLIAVSVNGRELGKTKLKSSEGFEELTLSMKCYSGRPYLKNFKIETWDGYYIADVIAEENENFDNVLLKNGDMVFCTVGDIKNDLLELKTKFGKHSLSKEQVSSIFFLHQPKSNSQNDYTLQFQSGQKITGKLDRIDANFVYMSNDLFSKLKITREYCRALITNSQKIVKFKDQETFIEFGDNRVFGSVSRFLNGKLELKNRNLLNKTVFNSEMVSTIRFQNRLKRDSSDWLLHLRNGEFLPCTLKSMKSDEVNINFAGKDIVLKNLDFTHLFRIPLEKKGSLRILSPYNDAAQIPEENSKFSINFTLEQFPRENSSEKNVWFWLKIFADKSFRNCYQLRIRAQPTMQYKTYLKAEEHGEIKFLEKNNFSIKVDKEKAVFEVWVNGIKWYTFTDDKGFLANEYGMNFSTYSSFRASKLRVGAWNDGNLDTDKYVITKDWQIHKGSISEITDEKLIIEGKTIQLADIREISVGTGYSMPKKKEYQIKLCNQTVLKVDDLSIDLDIVHVLHPILGKINFRIDEIIEIKAE